MGEVVPFPSKVSPPAVEEKAPRQGDPIFGVATAGVPMVITAPYTGQVLDAGIGTEPVVWFKHQNDAIKFAADRVQRIAECVSKSIDSPVTLEEVGRSSGIGLESVEKILTERKDK